MGNIQIIAVHDAIMGPIYAAAAVRLENIFNRVMRQKAPIALCVPPMSFFCVCSRSSRKAPVLLLLLLENSFPADCFSHFVPISFFPFLWSQQL
jgi:hypothetical protein